MHFQESLVVAALAAVPILATSSSVNVYWGQQGNGDLSTACQDPSIEYITLGFITSSPENGGPSGLPGTNFGAHCWAGYYSANGHESKLLTTCPYLTPGISVCQGLGKKVLLSVGGVYDAVNNYTVSSPENGVAFAEFVWGAFGPYSEDWQGKPRPFDTDEHHNAVDGFDFDLESTSAGDEGYAAMITTLRALITASGREDIITAAPQCPLDEWQTMTHLLDTVRFDRLWIQFYNNPQCALLKTDGTPNPGFNYAAWEEYLADTPSRDARLHIGLPGSAGAAGSGYVDASVAGSVLCEYADYPMFAGVMVWDQWFAAQNTADGLSYNQALYESMKCGCKACPVPTSTSSTIVSTSTVATDTATSISTLPSVTVTVAPPAPISNCAGVTGWDKDGTNIGFYADAASATYSACLALCEANESCLTFGLISTPACALYDYVVEGNIVKDSNSANTFYSIGDSCPRPSGSSSVVDSASETSTLSSSSASIELSTFVATSDASTSTAEGPSSSATETASLPSQTITASATQASTSTAEGPSSLATETVSVSSETQSASATETGSVTSDTSTSSVILSSSTASWSNTTWAVGTTSSEPQTTPITITSSSVHLSTRPHTTWSNTTWTSSGVDSSAVPTSQPLVSTHQSSSTTEMVYSSTILTATSCAASVTDCPGTPHVTKSSYLVSTTVVPVTETPVAPQPTSSAGEYTTQTFYSTTVLTVTSCAPTVTDCPGTPHITTSIIPVSSTVVPVGPPGGGETVTATVIPVTSTSIAGPVTDGEQLTTSTIYSTTIYTVTSCAPAITDCPGRLGSVTTQIIAVSTTVCPVTETGHASPSSPAETSGNDSTASDTGSVGRPSTPAGNEGSHPSPSDLAGNEGSHPSPSISAGKIDSHTSTSDLAGNEGSYPSPSIPAGKGGSQTSPSVPADNQGARPSPPEKTQEGTSTLTVKTNMLSSTITVPATTVATPGSEDDVPPPINNAVSGFSSGHSNSTATQTFSLAMVRPTVAGGLPPKSTETSVVTAGAAQNVVGAGVGMTIVMGFMFFML